MGNPYDSLMMTNPGNAFMQAFQGGQQMRRDSETRNALSKYAANPEDPAVFSELSKWNPEMAIQVRGQQQQQQQHALEQHRDNILKGAQIIRQFGVRDQQTWDAAKAAAMQMGVPMDGVPAQFDPQYVQGMVSIADAFSKQQGDQGTTMQRDYQFLQQQNPQLAEQYLRNKAEGSPLIASNGDGTFTIVPRSMAGGQSTPPPPPGFVIDGEGGPTQPASGGFPR